MNVRSNNLKARLCTLKVIRPYDLKVRPNTLNVRPITSKSRANNLKVEPYILKVRPNILKVRQYNLKARPNVMKIRPCILNTLKARPYTLF